MTKLIRSLVCVVVLACSAFAQGVYSIGSGANDWVSVAPGGTWVDGYGNSGIWFDANGDIDLVGTGNVLKNGVGAAIGDSDFINLGPSTWCRTS